MIVLVAERGTPEWRAAHRGHITASDAQSILARPGSKRYAELVRRMVLDFEGHGLHTDEHPEPWAERHEADLIAAIATYRRTTGQGVESPGFVTHDKYTWCGASPHGLVGSAGVVHFRVRQTLRSWYARAALTRADYARVHMTMFVTERAWCDVCDYWNGGGLAPDRLRTLRVKFDHQVLLAEIFPRLVSLWDAVRESLGHRAESPTGSSPSAAPPETAYYPPRAAADREPPS